MPFVREFIWGHDDDYGIDGWKPKHMPHFNVVGADFGMAHDVLEHHDARDASIEAEFRAFGAMLYLRAEPEWWAARAALLSDPALQMSGDIAEFVFSTVCADESIAQPPRHARLSYDLERVLTRATRMALREMISYRIEDFADRRPYTDALRNAAGWMRIGYRQAARRYKLDLDERVHLFDSVIEAVKRHKHGDYNDVLRVSVDVRKVQVAARIVRYRDPYE